MSIRRIIRMLVDKLNQSNYVKTIPAKVAAVRYKPVIKVVFVLHEVAMWKTEALYLTMLNHKRFDPVICPIVSHEELPESAVRKYLQLVDYLKRKKYNFVEAASIDSLTPDITFYCKPYDIVYPQSFLPANNKGLICHVGYGLGWFNRPLINHMIVNRSWLFFVENCIVKKAFSGMLDSKGWNICVTGVPQTDVLMADKKEFADPWIQQDRPKKRIIWAPHFTVHNGLSCLDLSSFSLLSDKMLALAKKYENEIQIAFKPHPILYPTLIKEWGEEKAREYYDCWRTGSNTQCEEGDYIGLFKYSDAMIHDCGSFLLEYLYMNKPVLYTLRTEDSLDIFNDFGLKGYEQLYHGNSIGDVEKFIIDVINGIDPMFESRAQFIKEYLLPPNGKTASQNIIDAILGGG